MLREMGIHTDKLLEALVLPLLLTAILFFGPLVLLVYCPELRDPLLPSGSSQQILIWMRTLVVVRAYPPLLIN